MTAVQQTENTESPNLEQLIPGQPLTFRNLTFSLRPTHECPKPDPITKRPTTQWLEVSIKNIEKEPVVKIGIEYPYSIWSNTEKDVHGLIDHNSHHKSISKEMTEASLATPQSLEAFLEKAEKKGAKIDTSIPLFPSRSNTFAKKYQEKCFDAATKITSHETNYAINREACSAHKIGPDSCDAKKADPKCLDQNDILWTDISSSHCNTTIDNVTQAINYLDAQHPQILAGKSKERILNKMLCLDLREISSSTGFGLEAHAQIDRHKIYLFADNNRIITLHDSQGQAVQKVINKFIKGTYAHPSKTEKEKQYEGFYSTGLPESNGTTPTTGTGYVVGRIIESLLRRHVKTISNLEMTRMSIDREMDESTGVSKTSEARRLLMRSSDFVVLILNDLGSALERVIDAQKTDYLKDMFKIGSESFQSRVANLTDKRSNLYQRALNLQSAMESLEDRGIQITQQEQIKSNQNLADLAKSGALILAGCAIVDALCSTSEIPVIGTSVMTGFFVAGLGLYQYLRWSRKNNS